MPAPSPFDALADRLGLVAGRIEREAKLRIDAVLADIARERAEEKLRISGLERELRDRLASLKDGEPGTPGTSVTLGDVRPLIEQAVAAFPKPENGKSITVDEVRPMLQEMVDAIPRPQNGKSVTVDDVRPILAEMVAALPPAEPGAPGKSVTVDDVAPLIEDAVARRVAELPPVEPGKPGEPGREGPPGKLPIVSAWEDKVHYEGECVTLDGSTYQALKDTGRAPPHEDWRCIAQGGAHGLSFSIEGTFDPERKDYRALAVVALNGGSFVARRDNPGPCPGDGWQLLASQGKRGNPGEPGRSVKGEPGNPGPAVKRLEVDEEGRLTLTNGDGTAVELDLYPLLDKLRQD